MARLVAIDGAGILRRVYEASPDPDTPAKAQAACQNAAASFRRILATHEPTHVLAAFGAAASAARAEMYPPYGEGRTLLPDMLQAQLPAFLEMLVHLGLHPVSLPDSEARDMIATAVTRWQSEERGDAIVASQDKTLCSLLAQGVRVWDHFTKSWRDSAWVEEKYGVPPAMLTDLLSLCGDRSSGIPGVEKIGPKTAAKLLRAYQTLEGVMAGAGILKDATGEKLRKDRDKAFLSRELILPKTDVRLGITWNTIAWPSA